MPIPVIDLFAGPGGLGEGFASLCTDKNDKVFKLKLSIEKDVYAHRTLQLRAFFRAFPIGGAPVDYYDYLAGRITRDELFRMHREVASEAENETWLAELGAHDVSNRWVDERIGKALN